MIPLRTYIPEFILGSLSLHSNTWFYHSLSPLKHAMHIIRCINHHVAATLLTLLPRFTGTYVSSRTYCVASSWWLQRFPCICVCQARYCHTTIRYSNKHYLIPCQERMQFQSRLFLRCLANPSGRNHPTATDTAMWAPIIANSPLWYDEGQNAISDLDFVKSAQSLDIFRATNSLLQCKAGAASICTDTSSPAQGNSDRSNEEIPCTVTGCAA